VDRREEQRALARGCIAASTNRTNESAETKE
jgi:hypothetical protein